MLGTSHRFIEVRYLLDNWNAGKGRKDRLQRSMGIHSMLAEDKLLKSVKVM
jgi:hypothetical protein